MYDAAVALRDAMIELEVAVDGGKDSLSMAAAAGELQWPSRRNGWLWLLGCLPGGSMPLPGSPLKANALAANRAAHASCPLTPQATRRSRPLATWSCPPTSPARMSPRCAVVCEQQHPPHACLRNGLCRRSEFRAAAVLAVQPTVTTAGNECAVVHAP